MGSDVTCIQKSTLFFHSHSIPVRSNIARRFYYYVCVINCEIIKLFYILLTHFNSIYTKT